SYLHRHAPAARAAFASASPGYPSPCTAASLPQMNANKSAALSLPCRVSRSSLYFSYRRPKPILRNAEYLLLPLVMKEAVIGTIYHPAITRQAVLLAPVRIIRHGLAPYRVIAPVDQ